MAAKLLGHTVVLAVDNDAKQLKVHEANHPGTQHLEMTLGPETEAELVEAIRAAVPKEQWHRCWIHGSPPCQTQSRMRQLGAAGGSEGKRALGSNSASALAQRLSEREAYDKANREIKCGGIDLVAWTVDLIAKLEPPQFSIEEVNDGAGEVKQVMKRARRKHPELLDHLVVQMADYGIPHLRERVIASRPSTIYALRSRTSLKVSKHTTIRETIGASLEPEIVAILGVVSRPIVPKGCPNHKVRPCAKNNKAMNTVSDYTDGNVMIYTLDRPAPTVCCRALTFVDEYHSNVRSTSADELRALTTFPPEFAWPSNAGKMQQIKGYGNAVPPRFAQTLFAAAAPE